MIVIKKIPKKIYKVIAGKVILTLDIPTEFIIIFSPLSSSSLIKYLNFESLYKFD